MKMMLDTNICIHLIKHKPQDLLNKFARIAVGDVGLSSLTLAELEYGVAKSSRPDSNRAALRLFASPLEIASFDESAAAIYGKIRVVLEKRGHPIGSMDMLIAAHSLSLGARLITSNAAEFKRIPGLKVENWL
jgi:tRNA(fMet)-specific endonuclease VapC